MALNELGSTSVPQIWFPINDLDVIQKPVHVFIISEETTKIAKC